MRIAHLLAAVIAVLASVPVDAASISFEAGDLVLPTESVTIAVRHTFSCPDAPAVDVDGSAIRLTVTCPPGSDPQPSVSHAVTLGPLPEGFYGVELHEREDGGPSTRLTSRTLVVRRYARELKIAGIEPRTPVAGEEVILMVTQPCYLGFSAPGVGDRRIWLRADIYTSLPCVTPIGLYPVSIGGLPAGDYVVSLLSGEIDFVDPSDGFLLDSFAFTVEESSRREGEAQGGES